MKHQRPIRFLYFGVISALFAVVGVTAVFSTPSERAETNFTTYAPGQVIVQYRAYMTEFSAQAHTQGMNHNFIKSIHHHHHGKGPMHLVGIGDSSVEEAIAAYQKSPDVEYAQPNFVYRTTLAPNDASYGQLWGMNNTNQTVTGASYATHNPPGASYIGKDIDAELAWNVITDCSSTVVAVVDTGVNYTHQDLSSNMATGSYTCSVGTGTYGCDFVGSRDADPMDLNGHGTHVAGTIGAVGNNSVGVAGVCWKAKILAVRVLDASGSGLTSDIVAGLNFAIGTGAGEGKAKVVNMSLGGSSSDTAFNTALSTAQANGVVVVVAAGNSGNNHASTPGYPCDYTQDNIICVAAADQAYSRATFSDYGSTSVDIAAPGTNIRSSYFGTSTLVNPSENFSTGWTFSPAGGWGSAYTNCSLAYDAWYWQLPSTMYVLQNPGAATTFCNGGTIGNNRDDRSYRTFNLSSYSAAYAQSVLGLSLTHSGDQIYIGSKSAGGDPFAGGGSVVYISGPQFAMGSLTTDLSGCLSATCTFGFRAVTDANANLTGDGIMIPALAVYGQTVTTNAYAVLDGTSMASPHVAGIATMVRARNPNFTYTDTVQAFLTGGDTASAFTTYTVTGKTANAFGALKYIPDTTLSSVTSP